jgi:hypothetical protein
MQGHNLTFCQMQSPWIILVCFIETNRYARENCGTLAKPKVHLEYVV